MKGVWHCWSLRKVYWINLEVSKDRREAMEKMFASLSAFLRERTWHIINSKTWIRLRCKTYSKMFKQCLPLFHPGSKLPSSLKLQVVRVPAVSVQEVKDLTTTATGCLGAPIQRIQGVRKGFLGSSRGLMASVCFFPPGDAEEQCLLSWGQVDRRMSRCMPRTPFQAGQLRVWGTGGAVPRISGAPKKRRHTMCHIVSWYRVCGRF